MTERASKWSYVFLRIARKYNLPYGVVLWHAHLLSHKHEGYCCAQEFNAVREIRDAEGWHDYLQDMLIAAVAQSEIRHGVRNPWTGELYENEQGEVPNVVL
jgi:hypothetical protein